MILASIRDLAVEQWTTTVAFRETIEAMHADGLRLFVDVGARGNLAGFVEDILRGKPAFAIAANLPRRSGLTQLNHLVASLFAQGVPLNTDYLYARRRPRAIDWNAPEPPPARPSSWRSAFRRCGSSESLLASLRRPRSRDDPAPRARTSDERHSSHVGRSQSRALRRETATSRHHDAEPHPAAAAVCPPRAAFVDVQEELFRNPLHPAFCETASHELAESSTELPSPAQDAMLSFQETMQAFLQTQQEIMTAYLGVVSPITRSPKLCSSLSPA